MKYKVGDKVFSLNALYLFDMPHNGYAATFIPQLVLEVKYANERYFSTGCDNLDHTAGMDKWEVNSQFDGTPKYGNRILLHMSHDKGQIQKALNKCTSEAYIKAQKEKDEVISKAREEIKQANDKLQALLDTDETDYQKLLRRRHNEMIIKLQES